MSAISRRLALLLPMLAAPAARAQPAGGEVMVQNPWARASAGQSGTSAAYFSLSTHGAADRLIGASTPVARMAELHRSQMENGVMRMLPVAGLDIGAAPTALAPGGLHVMLMGLSKPLRAGESFPLTLRFAKAAAVTITVPVLPAGAPGPQAGHNH